MRMDCFIITNAFLFDFLMDMEDVVVLEMLEYRKSKILMGSHHSPPAFLSAFRSWEVISLYFDHIWRYLKNKLNIYILI